MGSNRFSDMGFNPQIRFFHFPPTKHAGEWTGKSIFPVGANDIFYIFMTHRTTCYGHNQDIYEIKT